MFNHDSFDDEKSNNEFIASCVVAFILAIMIAGFLGFSIYEEVIHADHSTKECTEKLH